MPSENEDHRERRAERVVISVDEHGSATESPAPRSPGARPAPGRAVADSVRIDDPDDRRRAGEARQEDEADELGSALPAGVVTRGQLRGAVWGGLMGLVIGALVFAPMGFIPMDDATLLSRIGLAAVIGAFGGTVVGMVFGGGWEADREEKPRHRDPSIVVGYDAGPVPSEERPDRDRLPRG